ncbi:unnamed protein product, partial [Brassica rapa subsp. narinosa]
RESSLPVGTSNPTTARRDEMKLRRRKLPVVKAGWIVSMVILLKVVARFNEVVTKLLLEGAIDAIEANEVLLNQVIWVLGSFDLGHSTALSPKLSQIKAIIKPGDVTSHLLLI